MVPAKEAARIIGIAPPTLCAWRKAKKGPPYYARVGRIYYDRSDLSEWIKGLRIEA
jgi:predicted site-specific integrase-resolvase